MNLKEKILLGIGVGLICTVMIHGGLVIQAQEEPAPAADCKWNMSLPDTNSGNGIAFLYHEGTGKAWALDYNHKGDTPNAHEFNIQTDSR